MKSQAQVDVENKQMEWPGQHGAIKWQGVRQIGTNAGGSNSVAVNALERGPDDRKGACVCVRERDPFDC